MHTQQGANREFEAVECRVGRDMLYSTTPFLNAVEVVRFPLSALAALASFLSFMKILLSHAHCTILSID